MRPSASACPAAAPASPSAGSPSTCTLSASPRTGYPQVTAAMAPPTSRPWKRRTEVDDQMVSSEKDQRRPAAALAVLVAVAVLALGLAACGGGGGGDETGEK